MSENWEFCCECGIVTNRIGLDDEPNEYAHCEIGEGCSQNVQITKRGEDGM